MKKIVLFLSITIIAACADGLTQQSNPTCIVSDERVLFDKPTQKSGARGIALKGEKVEILETSKDRERIGEHDEYWYQVKTKSGKIGWIYGAYLEGLPCTADMKEGISTHHDPLIKDDIPSGFKIFARPMPFKSKKELLSAPNNKRYEYVTYTFSKKEHSLLKEYGFFMKSLPPDSLSYIEWDDMVDLYNDHSGVERPQEYVEYTEIEERPKYRLVPLFISSDYLLHLYHLLFMRMVEDLETKKFYPAIKHLTSSLLKQSIAGYRAAKDPAMRDAWKRVAGFFAVPASIMKSPIGDKIIADFVARDISSISKASGFAPSAISGEEEDFSQYKPRGHYNKNDILRTYFKVMMWYGRIYFPANKPLPTIIIARLLSGAQETKQWESIYIPTSYIVGRSDDLDYYDARQCLSTTIGTGIDLTSTPDSKKLDDFAACLKGMKAPRIASGRTVKKGKVSERHAPQEIPRGFRFMGQRFIPDSYVFTMFTSPRVGSNESPRNMPSGLDVMAILESPEAETLLMPEIKRIPGFADRYASIKQEFASYDESQWRQNIYWGWLDCLRALYLPPSPKLHPLFATPAWRHRLLLSGHGSWAELRHDTILYAKQSYAEMGGPPPETIYYAGQPYIPRGYVEPNPTFFQRLQSLASMTGQKMTSAGVLTDEYREKLEIFTTAVQSLGGIASKECENEKINDDEFLTIANITKKLRHIVLPRDDVFMDDTYKKMALIADVHTDAFSGRVLEVGVGKPREIYLYVKDRNGARVCLGYCYSYYEFTVPMSARMTDEEWRAKVYDASSGTYLKHREPTWLRRIPSAD